VECHSKSTAKERSNSKVTKHLNVIQQKYKAVVLSESVAAAVQHLVYTAAKHQSVGHSCALGSPKVVLPSSVVEVELVDISQTQVVHTTGHLQQQIQVSTAYEANCKAVTDPSVVSLTHVRLMSRCVVMT